MQYGPTCEACERRFERVFTPKLVQEFLLRITRRFEEGLTGNHHLIYDLEPVLKKHRSNERSLISYATSDVAIWG